MEHKVTRRRWMITHLLSELAVNISLLISLVFIQNLTQLRGRATDTLKLFTQGLFIGLTCIILMNNSFESIPGLIFDTRTILLSVSGLYLGLIPTALGAIAAVIFRIMTGGIGTIAGILTIVVSATLGITAGLLLKSTVPKWGWIKNIAFSVLVHAGVILIFLLFLPHPTNLSVARNMIIPFLFIYPLISGILGRIIINQREINTTHERMKESHDLYRSLFFDNNSIMLLIDPATGNVADANSAAVDFYGWSRSTMVGMSIESINKASPQEINEKLNETQHNQLKHFFAVHRRADDSFRNVEIHTNLIGREGKPYILSIIYDITDRLETEMKLQKSEYQLSRAEIISRLGHWELDLNKKSFTASEGASKIYGVSLDNLDMSHIQSVPLEKERARMDKALSDLIQGISPYELTFQIRRPSDSEIAVIHSIAEYDREKNTVFGVIHDVTEYKKSEEMVQEEKERLSVTLHSIGDGVITTDRVGNIQLMNKVAEELTGWTLTEAVGQPLPMVFNIVDEFTRMRCTNPVDLVFDSGGVIELANHTMLLTKDGRELIIADSGAPIKDKRGTIIGTVLVFRDTTEKQMLQNRLQRAERLESLGVLAGGIAHDFNNLLAGIFGYLEMANTVNKDPQVGDYIQSAMQVYKRTVDLTRQLLTFSKGNRPHRKAGDLSSLIRDSVSFSLSGSFVTCDIFIDENLSTCSFDRNQIGQVLDNLLINATQAMPEGGTIILKAENIYLETPSEHSLPEGNYVRVSIKDSGHGIPKEILPRIFDPFYTTKELGSGLGLATCYSILDKHDGAIDVQSDRNGTTFRFFLQAVLNKMEDNEIKKGNSFKSSGNILVMDDEPSLRQIIGHMLSSIGFMATAAKDGKELLSILENGANEGIQYRAAILDLTIPGGMGGVETLKQIREKGHTFPVFAASGYSEDPVIATPESFGFDGSISKPFQGIDIAEMLRRHLEE